MKKQQQKENEQLASITEEVRKRMRQGERISAIHNALHESGISHITIMQAIAEAMKGKTMPRDVPSPQPERQRPIPIPTPQRQVLPQAPSASKEKPSMPSFLPFFQRPLQPVPKVSPPQWRPSVPQSRPQKNKWLFIIGAILIIIVVGTGLSLLFSSTDCGQDIECFYSLASECKTAKVTTVVSTATLALSARSCTLTKTITALSSDEPKAIQDLILKKSMKCTYSQGAFDKGYITGISTNLEACKGELKDALESVISA